MSNGDKYIKFIGSSMQPLTPMKATDAKLKELSGVGYKQGKDYDIVPLKIILDLGKSKKTGDIVSKGITREQAEEIFSKAEKRKERTESRKSQRIKNYNTKKKIKKYVNSVRNALYSL